MKGGIGALRHRITIEAPVETQGEDGTVTQAWETYAAVWASIEPLIGKEYFAQQREQAAVSHKIRMRALDGVTHKMRVSWGPRLFEIESALNVGERNRELVLMCRESV
jgi:SPP1 family predicted phage head-tail adaptor